MFAKLRPSRGYVLVRRTESHEEKSAGGIIIPGTAERERGQTGVVEAVGAAELRPHDGGAIPVEVAVGDTAFFGKYAGTDAGKDLLVLRANEILGIVEK